MSDEFLIPPPASMTVDHERRPVLYLPDGRVLVRQAGFRGETAMTTQNAYGGARKDSTAKCPKKSGGKK